MMGRPPGLPDSRYPIESTDVSTSFVAGGSPCGNIAAAASFKNVRLCMLLPCRLIPFQTVRKVLPQFFDFRLSDVRNIRLVRVSGRVILMVVLSGEKLLQRFER